MQSSDPLDIVYERQYVCDREGNRKELAGAVSYDEARFLNELIINHQLKRVLETGVANGLSTLAMSTAASQIDGKIIGIDPCQIHEHKETALVLLEEFGVRENFSLLDGPAHLEIPRLIERKEQFDLIFIDGMHLFDFKLVDVFLADQVLRDGGWLLLHDLLIPSVKKTARFIERHKDYRRHNTPELYPPIPRRLRYLAGAVLKAKPMCFWWPNGFSNLLVLQKRSTTDHPWNFYKNF